MVVVRTVSIVMKMAPIMVIGDVCEKILTSRVINSSLMRKSWIFLMSMPSFTWTFII